MNPNVTAKKFRFLIYSSPNHILVKRIPPYPPVSGGK